MPNVLVTTAAINEAQPPVMNHIFFGSTQSFLFPVSPREITFSDLSANYREIPRSARYPLISFSELSLTKVSLDFRLFDRASGGEASVEERMKFLRNLATAPGVVWFQGIDRMLQEPLQPVNIGGTQTRNLAYWRITDLTMDVVYRDSFNRATQVDCKMRLTEERNPVVPTVALAKITYDDTPKRTDPAPKRKTSKRKPRKKASKKTKTGTKAVSRGPSRGGRAPRRTVSSINRDST